MLGAYNGCSLPPTGLYPSMQVKLARKFVLDIEVLDAQFDYIILLG